jgi:hypothetical protein
LRITEAARRREFKLPKVASYALSCPIRTKSVEEGLVTLDPPAPRAYNRRGSLRRASTAATLAAIAACACLGHETIPAGQVGDPSTVAGLQAHFPGASKLLAQAQRYPARSVRNGGGFLLSPPAPRSASPGQAIGVRRAPDPVAPDVSLPSSASEPFEVAIPGGKLRVTHAGARTVRGRMQEGAVVYEGIEDGVDLVAFATASGVEELVRVDSASRRIAYTVDLAQGWRLHTPREIPGLVEVRDERDVSRVRLRAAAAWDMAGHEIPVEVEASANRIALGVPAETKGAVLIDPLWESAGTMLVARQAHTATMLPTGKLLIVGGSDPLGNPIAVTELYDPSSGGFSTTGSLAHARTNHTATLLSNGNVLVVGGSRELEQFPYAAIPSELYDAKTGAFRSTGSPATARCVHTALRLTSGKVLVAGGTSPANQPIASAELYDPSTERFTTVGSMAVARGWPQSLLLPSGKALVLGSGGVFTVTTYSPSVELFDPETSTFSEAGSLTTFRNVPSATLLPSGDVLVAGGFDENFNALASAELYDPAAETSMLTGSLSVGRAFHTATLLPDGGVLIADGQTLVTALAEEELYEPASGTFLSAGTGLDARSEQTANLLPSGAVLLAGGSDNSGNALASTEAFVAIEKSISSRNGLIQAPFWGTATLFASGSVLFAGGSTGQAFLNTTLFDPGGHGGFSLGPPFADGMPRWFHTATLLESGQALIAGGANPNGDQSDAELYDAASNTFTETGPLITDRDSHSATLLPSGTVLIAGGFSWPGVDTATASAEIYDPDAGAFSATGSMVAARQNHASTLLQSGLVLLVGGWSAGTPSQPSTALATAELYDSSSGTFKQTSGSMSTPRVYESATVLPSGSVLVSGGITSATAASATETAELYDPATDEFLKTGSMAIARAGHTATLLPSGKVLVVGGANSGPAELYDPATETFYKTGTPLWARVGHTATLLPSGQVLVVGGYSLASGDKSIPVAEVYNPSTGTFSLLDPDIPQATRATLTLLPTNDLLVAGGTRGGKVSAIAQLFDAAAGVFTATGSLATARSDATATLVPSGGVVVAGGKDGDGHALRSAELYQSSPGQFSTTASLAEARFDHTATLLPTGKILIAAGSTDRGPTASVELFDPANRSSSVIGNLEVARTGHAAALLSSGQVLVAGGVDAQKQPVTTLEVFDVPSAQTVSITTTETSTGVAASPLANGNAVVAFDTAIQEYVSGADIRTFSPSIAGPFAAKLWLSGDTIVCSAAFCQDFSSALATPTDSFLQTLASGNTGMARLADGSLYLGGEGAYGIVQPLPNGALRPIVHSLGASTIRSDDIVTITGSGFEHVTAAGATGLPAIPASVPLVFFMPAEGGGPIFGAVQGGWTDTSLAWQVPRTSYPGPGWVHVIVDGVPSVGVFVTLEGLAAATSCDQNSECASGYCVGTLNHSVCCNVACTGGCDSCLASDQAPGGKDGVCGPRKKGSVATAGCEPTDDKTCTSTGLCNGLGDCNYPPAGTACMSSTVESGVCASGVCVPTPTTCTTSAECSAGLQCDATGHCAPATFPAAPVDPGACQVSRIGKPSDARWALVIAPLVVIRRRRKRRPDGTANASVCRNGAERRRPVAWGSI